MFILLPKADAIPLLFLSTCYSKVAIFSPPYFATRVIVSVSVFPLQLPEALPARHTWRRCPAFSLSFGAKNPLQDMHSRTVQSLRSVKDGDKHRQRRGKTLSLRCCQRRGSGLLAEMYIRGSVRVERHDMAQTTTAEDTRKSFGKEIIEKGIKVTSEERTNGNFALQEKKRASSSSSTSSLKLDEDRFLLSLLYFLAGAERGTPRMETEEEKEKELPSSSSADRLKCVCRGVGLFHLLHLCGDLLHLSLSLSLSSGEMSLGLSGVCGWRLTSLSQVMVGTGFPEALHSSLTRKPFFTTMLPSSGTELTRGGTEKKGRRGCNSSREGVAREYTVIVSVVYCNK